ncbi:hypothetical protein [Grimontia sp. NTOU-MAR1]|uniref:hypothetical protein n=1 Tax=Grimontia sp. NTOU-MAR1 TaxID=3111011 RepID=UPI002DB8724A|nr:hypothetical protein [Grimontia sp. NTOU-MAR1]WRW00120.1 hypothetical protein VP504_24370 [Grimontia sp. NTOU-MAR1]
MKYNRLALAMALLTAITTSSSVVAKDRSSDSKRVFVEQNTTQSKHWAHGGFRGPRLSNSDVDFSNCREIAGGIVVDKSEVSSLIPNDVSVNSLTDMGFEFDGSDNLGMLIIRSLQCEAIQVTDAKGRVKTDENVAVAHLGTPINTSNLPATTFNLDGVNGADFNIYTLSYQTSSRAYYGAMARMGMKTAKFNKHMMNVQVDTTPGTCDVAQLSVNIPGNSDYSFSIFGEVVQATAECNPGGASFTANWWSS